MAQPDVTYTRKELIERQQEYREIDACLAGTRLIKSEAYRTEFLPYPDPASMASFDTQIADAAADRYTAYVSRAVFYRVTSRTLSGLIGQIFARVPEITVPPALRDVISDSSGAGVGAVQQSKEAARLAMAYGRGGLFVDYPANVDADGKPQPTTRLQLQRGDVKPTLSVYKPSQIINWRTMRRGAKVLLSLVVLQEIHTTDDDGFADTTEEQYRELRIDDTGGYVVQLWRKEKGESAAFTVAETFYPTDAKGARLTEIPFTFFGAEDNTPEVDEPPMHGIASLNLAHYRSSADFEESAFLVGQPTLVMSGITKEWYDKVLKGKVVLGSRSGIPLPQGGGAELLQAQDNNLALKSMEIKEAQMLALGAKLLTPRQGTRTAFEVGVENAADTSVLSDVAKNVSAAMTWALEWCAKLVGANETGISFKLNTNFDLTKLSAQEIAEVVRSWQSGAISLTEMRTSLRNSGVATQTDDEYKGEVDNALFAPSPALPAGSGSPQDGNKRGVDPAS